MSDFFHSIPFPSITSNVFLGSIILIQESSKSFWNLASGTDALGASLDADAIGLSSETAWFNVVGCRSDIVDGLERTEKGLPSHFQYKPHQIQKLKCFSSHPAVVFSQFIEARCYVENEDVNGAAPTGDAPTTSEWSTILLPEACLTLEIWRYH